MQNILLALALVEGRREGGGGGGGGINLWDDEAFEDQSSFAKGIILKTISSA